MLCVVKKLVREREKRRARPESGDRMTANRGRQLTRFWQWHTVILRSPRGQGVPKSQNLGLKGWRLSTWRTAAAVNTVLGARWRGTSPRVKEDHVLSFCRVQSFSSSNTRVRMLDSCSTDTLNFCSTAKFYIIFFFRMRTKTKE